MNIRVPIEWAKEREQCFRIKRGPACQLQRWEWPFTVFRPPMIRQTESLRNDSTSPRGWDELSTVLDLSGGVQEPAAYWKKLCVLNVARALSPASLGGVSPPVLRPSSGVTSAQLAVEGVCATFEQAQGSAQLPETLEAVQRKDNVVVRASAQPLVPGS